VVVLLLDTYSSWVGLEGRNDCVLRTKILGDTMAQHNEKILVANNLLSASIRASYAGQIHYFLACFYDPKLNQLSAPLHPNFESFNGHRSPNIETGQKVGFKKFQLGRPGWFVDLNNQSSGIKFERFDMTTDGFAHDFGPS